MTISSTVSRNNYSGSGTAGPFPFSFRVFAASDLVVTKRDSTGVETTLAYLSDYTVSGVGNPSGSVTLTAVLAAGYTLAIQRVMTLTQPTDLRNQGQFFAATHEDAFDRATMVDLTQQDAIDRSLKLAPSYDPSGFSMTLPAPSALKALVWNVAGTGFDNAALSAAQLSAWSATNNQQLDVFTSGFTPGVTTTLTLSRAPGNGNNVSVLYRTSGVLALLMHDQFSVSGTTLTLTSAVPVGTTRIEVAYQYTYQVNTAVSENVTFQQAGAGAVVRDTRARLRESYLSPSDYGAVSGVLTAGQATINDTSFATTVTQCVAQGKGMFLPDGDWALDAGFVLPSGVPYIAQSLKARLYHMPTVNGRTCFEVNAGGGAEAVCNTVLNLAIYSPDVAHTKKACVWTDTSSLHVDGVFISGAATGLGPMYGDNATHSCVGIRTRGREAGSVINIRVVADSPIQIGANPNTLATIGEDMDHWSWTNVYTVANGHYAITCDDGIGLMETTFAGYQAWVGGIGGFYMNDTRVAPTVRSRGISFANVRCEQATSAAGYWWNVTATDYILSLSLTKCFGDATCQGVSVTNCLQLDLERVVTARGSGNALIVASPPGGASVNIRSCYWQLGATFSLSGYTPTIITAYNASVMCGPSSAVYAESRTGTSVSVGTLQAVAAAGTDALTVVATASGDQMTMQPQGGGSGAWLTTKNSAGSDYTPMRHVFSTLIGMYRTGVATVAQAFQVDTSGQFSVNKRFFFAKDDGTIQNSAGHFAGSGVPSNANGSNGDFYERSDGTAAGKTLYYHKEGGVWVAAVP